MRHKKRDDELVQTPGAAPAALWEEIDRLTEAGELRRLSGAFARFV